MIPKTRGTMRRKVDLNDPEQARKRKVSANRCLQSGKRPEPSFRERKAACDAAWRRVSALERVERARNRYLSLAECDRLLMPPISIFGYCFEVRSKPVRYGELTRLMFRLQCRRRCRDRLQQRRQKPHMILSDDGQEFFADYGWSIWQRPDVWQKWATSQQVRRMVLLCKRAKIEPHVGFHQLRHTWASHAVMAGMPLAVVAKNLGHVDTRMVEKHYGHLAPSYVSEQVRKFAPRFGGTSNVTPGVGK